MSSIDWYKLNDDGSTQRVSTEELLARGERWTRIGETIAEDFVKGVRVHTCFLSLDHAGLGGPPNRPLLFETMPFGPTEYDQHDFRTGTIHEARRRHAEVCAMIRRERVWYRRFWHWLTRTK